MSKGINQETGEVNVYELLPAQGDSLMIVNCGTHFEIRYHHWGRSPLTLTDQNIEDLKQGLITFH